MTKPVYRIVSNTAFSVGETSDYSGALCLHHIGDTAPPLPMALYKVTGKLPCGKVVERMVIAESESGACSQASCGLSLKYETACEFERMAITQRIPFLIRGYGGTEF